MMASHTIRTRRSSLDRHPTLGLALVALVTTLTLLSPPGALADEELAADPASEVAPVSDVSQIDPALTQADAAFDVTGELVAGDPYAEGSVNQDAPVAEVVPEAVAPEAVAPVEEPPVAAADVAPAVASDVAPALVAAPVDSDGDGLSDDEELIYGTNALAVDTDSDGVSDRDEISLGTDPLVAPVVAPADDPIAGTDLMAAPTPTPHDPVLFPVRESVAKPYSPDLDTSVSCPPVCDAAAPEASLPVREGDSGGDSDSDGDGLFDAYEVSIGLNPQAADSDGDGLSDYEELTQADQRNGADPGSGDADGDGLSDGYEEQVSLTNATTADSDGDGLSDGKEINLTGTDPLRADSDNDGMVDSCDHDPWVFDAGDGAPTGGLVGERMECSTISTGTTTPPPTNTDQFDGTATLGEARDRTTVEGIGGLSGLAIFDEIAAGTDPLTPDVAGVTERLTGGDLAGTLADQRNHQSLDWPCDYCDARPDASTQVSIDSDRDGLRDVDEARYAADPTNPDTDGDTLLDGKEVRVYGTFPFSKDTEGDGLGDYQEVMEAGTNPRKNDSDGDTWNDGVEVLVHHTDPNDPNSHPTMGLTRVPGT
jgi:hypothetical protein